MLAAQGKSEERGVEYKIQNEHNECNRNYYRAADKSCPFCKDDLLCPDKIYTEKGEKKMRNVIEKEMEVELVAYRRIV